MRDRDLPELPAEAVLEGRLRRVVSVLDWVLFACAMAFGVGTLLSLVEIRERLASLEAPVAAEVDPEVSPSPSPHLPERLGFAEGMLAVAGAEVAALEEAVADARVWRVVRAMDVLARTEGCRACTAWGLTGRWGASPTVMAEAILLAADAHGVDPLDLVAISWRESRFDPRARGDTHLGDLVLSCGPTQVRVDFPGRPGCDSLADPEFAFDWTARRLASLRGRDGRLRLYRWNGSERYEVEVRRDVELMRSALGG